MGTSAIISFLHLPSRKGDKSSEVVVWLSMWRDNNNNNINKSVTHAVLSFHRMYFVTVQLHILVSLRVFSWGTLQHQLFSLLVADRNLETMVCMNRVSEYHWWPWAKHHSYLTCSALSREELKVERKWKMPQLAPPLLSGERKWKASCPENVEHMQILPSVGFILVVLLVFRQHIFVWWWWGGGGACLFFASKTSFPGRSHVGLFLTNEEQKRVGWLVT